MSTFFPRSIGNTAARPGSPVDNHVHTNTQTKTFDVWDGAAWETVPWGSLLGGTGAGEGASGVGLEDAGGNTTETNVEGAIAELYGLVGGGGSMATAGFDIGFNPESTFSNTYLHTLGTRPKVLSITVAMNLGSSIVDGGQSFSVIDPNLVFQFGSQNQWGGTLGRAKLDDNPTNTCIPTLSTGVFKLTGADFRITVDQLLTDSSQIRFDFTGALPGQLKTNPPAATARVILLG